MVGSSINCCFLKIEKKREGKKFTLTSRTLSPVSQVTPSALIIHQINEIITRGSLCTFKSQRSRSWSSLLNESASQKYTHCCHSNNGHLSQMNETTWRIFSVVFFNGNLKHFTSFKSNPYVSVCNLRDRRKIGERRGRKTWKGKEEEKEARVVLGYASSISLTLLSCSPHISHSSITLYTHAKREPILKCPMRQLELLWFWEFSDFFHTLIVKRFFTFR